jgi:hypothetical protein
MSFDELQRAQDFFHHCCCLCSNFVPPLPLPYPQLSHHHHVQHHQHLQQPYNVTEGSVGCPGSVSTLVCLVSPHNKKGQTMPLIGGRDESSSAHCISAFSRGVRHILNTPKSLFVRVDCVSIHDLDDLVDNTRCNRSVCAPTKVGKLLLHSSSRDQARF